MITAISKCYLKQFVTSDREQKIDYCIQKWDKKLIIEDSDITLNAFEAHKNRNKWT
jgi:hypothetical protein